MDNLCCPRDFSKVNLTVIVEAKAFLTLGNIVMTRLLLTLLVSFVPIANAEVNNLYYCVTESAKLIYGSETGKAVPLQLNNFVMKRRGKQIEIKSEDGNSTLPIVFEEGESFSAVDTGSQYLLYMSYREGQFQKIIGIHGTQAVSTIQRTGTCEEFD